MTTAEAKAILDVLLPLALPGHVLDVRELRGAAREAGALIEDFVAVGATFGGAGGVLLLPYYSDPGAKRGQDVNRWIVARPTGP